MDTSFKIDLSPWIRKHSVISRTNLLFLFAKMLNSLKDETFLQFKRWLWITLWFDGLVFLIVKCDIPICSPDRGFEIQPSSAVIYKEKFVIYKILNTLKLFWFTIDCFVLPNEGIQFFFCDMSFFCLYCWLHKII